jgi:putative ABC transport system permease protein
VIWYNIHTRLKLQSSHLQRNIYSGISGKRIRVVKNGAWFAAITAIAWLVYTTIISQSLNTGVFFIAGALLLLAGIGFFYAFVHAGYLKQGTVITSGSLAMKNLSRNPLRSFRIVVLFSLGTFLIIAIGLNRKDPHRDSGFPASGTGGFLYYMEMTIPVLSDLNNPAVRTEQGIDSPVRFVQMRRSDGDDASCLNLNRVVSPRILGIPSEEFKDRFSFIRSTEDLDPESPWISLKTELPGGVVPAVIDQTVMQWGLGKKPGDTLVYLNESGAEMKLRIIGGLANSIFQGHVLVDEQLFLKHFPSSSGTHVFLVDGEAVDVSEIQDELMRAFRNEGLELQLSADRLAMFNQVENTYLSIFMLLGGLAMILGTVGLGVSLARNLQDRKAEMGIMRAIGYRRSWILRIITHEHLILLLAGALTGTMTAFVAILPSILSEFVQASWFYALVIVALILLNGFIWIYAITRYFLRKNLMGVLRNE